MREGLMRLTRAGSGAPRGLDSPVEALWMTKKSPPPIPMLWAFWRPTQSRAAMAASTAEPFLFRMSLGSQTDTLPPRPRELSRTRATQAQRLRPRFVFFDA